MNYSVKELRENLLERILGLGIDTKFLENPVFPVIISYIDSLIRIMNMFEVEDIIIVREEEGSISFKWPSNTGDKYTFTILSSDPGSFRCIKTEERKPVVRTNGKLFKSRNIIEVVVTIDELGSVSLTTNCSMADNIDCKSLECNNYTWSQRECYTSKGVMNAKGYKTYSRRKMAEDFDEATIASMLYIPRKAFDFGFWYDKYESETLLVRDKLDTARIFVEDKTKGIKYRATTLLSQRRGLRDMILPDYSDIYPQDVVIYPLSQKEIDSMIKKESNPIVAEGLREYATGRSAYSYNSSEDKDFISEGISKSKILSK